MKNMINIKEGTPMQAAGRVCIEYTDPLTKNIKERIKGNNHVFVDSFFSHLWYNQLDTLELWLTDSTKVVDPAFPYLLGQPIGYGIYNNGSSGAYRGAWNAALGFVKRQTASTLNSKFVYDFTPIQALGTLKSIGLTNQYIGGNLTAFKSCYMGILTGYPSFVEGAYGYSISSAGVITKRHILTGIDTTINVSSIVGAATGNSKAIGFEPATGNFFVKVYSSTAANRYVYRFADSTFSSAINTYSTTNNTTNQTSGFFVYGNKLFDIGSVAQSINFVSNIAPVAISRPTFPPAITLRTTATGYTFSGQISHGTLVMSGFTGLPSSAEGTVFDMATETFIGLFGPCSSNYYGFRHPLDPDNTILTTVYTSSNAPQCINAAAVYVLPVDAPVRPAGYGMTITYELEIQY